ncbi:hypothetical protein AQF52_3476 [Streptomyces venezuelae]|nr:hypothetical protein AQF52_3476 [Streptomyces venezuelae]CUM40533.1 hypothetical protein BN2537_10031 [Streptomyces venezuelae]
MVIAEVRVFGLVGDEARASEDPDVLQAVEEDGEASRRRAALVIRVGHVGVGGGRRNQYCRQCCGCGDGCA